jgi:glycosyltransferase involved in cell wall biosynthesis
MKIAVLTSVHSPFDIRIFHKQCKSLARAGHEVTLISRHDRDEVVDGVRIKGIGGGRAHRLQRATRIVWQLYREAVRLDAAAYHLHDPELIPIGLLLRKRGKHVIYDAHEDLASTIPDKEYLPRRLDTPIAWVSGRLEREAARHFSAVVTATPAIGELFRPVNARTVVVQNFAILDEWDASAQLPWSIRPQLAAYAGGMNWGRGLRQMVEAMGFVPAHLGARLALAGAYSPPQLQTAAAALPGWKHVDDLGVLTRAGVVALLGRARAGLLVYQPEPFNIVAGPNKLFEYMAAGMPIVASDFPLWRRIVDQERCGVMVDPTDPRAIGEAIGMLLSDRAEAEAMGRRGRQAAERQYSWEVEERKLLALYAGLDSPGEQVVNLVSRAS